MDGDDKKTGKINWLGDCGRLRGRRQTQLRKKRKSQDRKESGGLNGFRRTCRFGTTPTMMTMMGSISHLEF